MLNIEHATKSFGVTRALEDASLTIGPGQIVGLVGENGAGKTTLMRAAAGEIALDRGTVMRPERVGFVHQHFTIVSAFTIAENLALGRRDLRIVTRALLEQAATEEIERSGVRLENVRRVARELPVGERAKLELIKAIADHPQLLILDEPTSVLTPLESAEFFALIRQLAAAGTAVVFISHKVPEVLEIAQRIVVMRRGAIVADHSAAGMTATEIAEAMVGKRDGAPVSSPAPPSSSVPLLALDNLTVHKSEMVAIAGVAGNGQSQLMESIRARVPRDRLAFIPEDRTRDALIGEMTIAENIALGARQWNPKRANETAQQLIALYNIKARGPRQLARELSGGNQQKVVLARELHRNPELIVAAEPTRGLDLDATAFVHQQLRAAVAAGAGLLLITSDLDEAFELADTIQVIYRGRLSARMNRNEARQRVATLMAGVA